MKMTQLKKSLYVMRTRNFEMRLLKINMIVKITLRNAYKKL